MSNTGPGAEPGPAPATSAAGKTPAGGAEKDIAMQIFSDQCAQCHVIGTTGKKTGLPLDHEGAHRTLAWIEKKIRHPESTNPRTDMPNFPKDRITDQDLHVLAHYLAGLK